MEMEGSNGPVFRYELAGRRLEMPPLAVLIASPSRQGKSRGSMFKAKESQKIGRLFIGRVLLEGNRVGPASSIGPPKVTE